MESRVSEWTAYRTAVREFEAVLEHAKAISTSLVGKVPERRCLIYGEQIFVKLLAHCVTLRKLAPDPTRRTQHELWDLPSMCVVARCVIEAHDAFVYIAGAQVDSSEGDFRLALWELHDKNRRLKMLEAIGFADDPRTAQIREEAHLLLTKVTSHARFTELPRDMQKKMRDDPPPFHLSQRKRCLECNVDFDFYNAVTMQLSQYAHTLPYSVRQLFGFKGGSLEALKSMKQPLQHSLPFLSRAANVMRQLFPAQTPAPPSRVARMMDVAMAVSASGIRNVDIGY